VKNPKDLLSQGMSRRDSLKLSGLALGGLALGTRAGATCNPPSAPCYPTEIRTQQYSYYTGLPTLDYRQLPVVPNTPYTFPTPSDTPPLLENEMRITFMGSCIPPVRRAQAMMSVFVEVGSKDGKALDQFVFDCGSGCVANYGAMGVGFGRMDKIFLNHLHGDHMSDLTHIYCFGPSGDRLSPLYVFGPGPSGIRNPVTKRRYADGTKALCQNLREALRWHSESFSFQNTSWDGYEPPTRRSWGLPHDPVPVSDDAADDGYAMVPIQLDWRDVGGLAYFNRKTGVKITHFPVIHCRKGSIGYKLEWNGLSMVYTSDTKPEYNTIIQSRNGGDGIDVLIHEMVTPPEVWAMGNSHYNQYGSDQRWNETVERLKQVQNSSHTPQGAFGYLLSQIHPRPRLAVATHFPVSDDTITCALQSINKHCPDIGTDLDHLGDYGLAWSFDLMIIRVFAGNPKPDIQRCKAQVLDYGFSPLVELPPGDLNPPKYATPDGKPDPYAQIDQSSAIDPGDDTFCDTGF
jgi:ribonuclease Z